MKSRQKGYLLAEWLLSALLGLLILSTAIAGLQAQLHMVASQRLPLQAANSAHWLFQRLEQAVLRAGEGGVHPFALDNPNAGSWGDNQLVLQRLVMESQLDCEGRKAEPGVILLERYFLRNDSASSDQVLACDAGHCQQGACQFWGDAGAALHAGVFAFVLRYGQRGHAGDALGYVTRLQLGAGAKVDGIKIGLALLSQDSHLRLQQWRWPLLWLQAEPVLTPHKRIRKAWVQTFEVPHG